MWFHHPVVDFPNSIKRHAAVQIDGASHRFKNITKCLWYLYIFFTILLDAYIRCQAPNFSV